MLEVIIIYYIHMPRVNMNEAIIIIHVSAMNVEMRV